MNKSTDQASAAEGAPKTTAFCKDLADGLHACSQPLTILRASLAAAEIPHSNEEDLRKLVRSSAKEVERLCVLFSYLQQFVAIESTEVELDTENLRQLVRHTLEGVDILFAEAGVLLDYDEEGEDSLSVVVDSSRFEHALAGVLLVVLGRVARGGKISIKVSRTGVFIKVVFQGDAEVPAALSGETRLSMAMSAANLRSLGGTLTWEVHPFAVQITVPMKERANPA